MLCNVLPQILDINLHRKCICVGPTLSRVRCHIAMECFQRMPHICVRQLKYFMICFFLWCVWLGGGDKILQHNYHNYHNHQHCRTLWTSYHPINIYSETRSGQVHLPATNLSITVICCGRTVIPHQTLVKWMWP